MANRDSNPQIRDTYSPLDTLARAALRRFGDVSPASIDGELGLLFIEFANLVVNDVVQHPYCTDPDISYYVSVTDARPIDDTIMIAGLLMHYALQQFSEKSRIYQPLYYQTLNQELWRRKNGNTQINMRPVDAPASNVANGLPE